MKIKQWDLVVTWEDGTTYSVADRVPLGMVDALEDLMDFIEAQDNTEKNEEEV